MRRIPWALVLVSAIVVTPAAAQQLDPPVTPLTSLQPGARALAFGRLGEGTGAIELWRMRSPHSSHGLIVTANVGWGRSTQVDTLSRHQNSSGGVRLSLGPALRRYATVDDPVNPYVYGRALVGYGYSGSEYTAGPNAHQHELLGSMATGVGLEWFPVPQVSLSGQAGLELGARYGRGSVGTHRSEQVSVSLATFGAALMLNLYWPPRDG